MTIPPDLVFSTAAVALLILALVILSYAEAFRVDNHGHKETLVRLYAFDFLPAMLARSLGLTVDLDNMNVDEARPFRGLAAESQQVLTGALTADEFQKILTGRTRDIALPRDHMNLALKVLDDADDAFQRKEEVQQAFNEVRDTTNSAFKNLLFAAMIAAGGWVIASLAPAMISDSSIPILNGVLMAIALLGVILFFGACGFAWESWRARQKFVQLAEEKSITVPALRLEWRLFGRLVGE